MNNPEETLIKHIVSILDIFEVSTDENNEIMLEPFELSSEINKNILLIKSKKHESSNTI